MDPNLPNTDTNPSDLKSKKKLLLIAGSTIGTVAIIVGLLFVLFHNGSGKSSIASGKGPNYSALASCNSGNQALLDHVPVDPSYLDQIVPLGQVGVPDHTLPTDHLYFSLKHPNGNFTDTVKAPIVSPGKVVVFSIENSGETVNGVQRANDYAISFAACQGVTFLFGHVEQLSGKLADAVKNKDWDQPCEKHTPATGEETFYCTKSTDIALNSGEAIGTAGGPNIGAFDFDTDSTTSNDAAFSNPKRYPNTTRTCGLNYFNPETQKLLYTLDRRTVEPRCGQIAQDKQGTAQGAWFAGTDPSQTMSDWNSHLSLIHHNIDPTLGILGVGGKISNPMAYLFVPAHSGTVNREPSEITPGSTIYCYYSNSTMYSTGQPGTGSVVLQLTDENTMKVAHQEQPCAATSTLTNPTTYYR